MNFAQRKFFGYGLLFLFVFLSDSVFGARDPAHTKVSLLSEKSVIEPGESFDVGLYLKMDPSWHTYSKNPGDAGLPTSVKWKLPQGFTAGPIRWPPPKKLMVSKLTNYVYEDEVLLLVNIQSPKQGLKSGQSILINGEVQWLECQESCIPGSAKVQISLKVGKTQAAAKPETVELFKKYQGIASEDPAIPTDNPPPTKSVDPLLDPMDPMAGTDVPTLPQGTGTARRRILEPTPPPVDMGGFWKAILGGFLGGIILNLMPCVLPIIGIKILSFVNQSKESPARARQLGIVFGLGVLISFWMLAVMVVVLQRAGNQVGWGFLFQDPRFLMVMGLLTTLVALNLFGLFEVELSSSTLTSANELASKEGFLGAFLNGVLATLLATPCTGPILSVPIGYAFTQSPMVVVLFFTSVGLGFAIPYLALSWNPNLLRWIPRPGKWMNRFKQAMGVPMILTALFLVWILSAHSVTAAKYYLGLLLLVSIAIWILSSLGRAKLLNICVVVLILATIAYSQIMPKIALQAADPVAIRKSSLIDWKPYSAAALQEALRSDQVVFIDFTALWCATCQVNKASSIEVESVSKKFKESNVIAFSADWTKANPEITEALRSFNRAGVPLYVFYPVNRSQPPIILPDGYLTPQIVLDAVDKAAGKKEELPK
jgi:thiol:disulfide interchange protein